MRIIDVGEDGARPYLVMEYLDGTDLDALIARDGPLPSVLAVDYLLQACEALAEAHISGIVHRDLKPANLFLTHRADGAASVKVLDFGISKILRPRSAGVAAHETSPLLLMGSPHYMSPEQMKSARNVDRRSDLWSLGAILHELVAGKPPFGGATITALCAAIMTEEPPELSSPRGDLPPELGAVVRRCLEKDPADRFANLAEFAAALAPLGSDAARDSALCIARVLDGGSDTDPGAHPVPAIAGDERLSDEPLRARTHVGRVAAFVVLLIACTGIGWFVQNDRAQREASSLPQATTVLPALAATLAELPMDSVASAPSAAPPPSLHRPVSVVPAETSAPAFASPRFTKEPNPTFARPLDTAPYAAGVANDDGSADNPY